MPNTPQAATPVKTPIRIKRLAYLLDSAIPLPGGRSIGLEAIVGLVPGVGDMIGALASCYIVAEGVRMGAPKRVVARMIGNVLLESTVGVVPLVGDLFDMVYKSNMRNIGMLLELEKASADESQVHKLDTLHEGRENKPEIPSNKRNSRWVIWVGLGVAVLLLVAVIWLVFKVMMFIAAALL